MVNQGLFGEILHGECGYLHDLRGVKFADGGEGLWRRNWSITHDANLYPTHGLGPIAQGMNINRGDAFDYLVEDYRLIDALRNGRPTDIDVYDAVAWSAVVGLSEQSVTKKGRPIDFPDFTRGAWKHPRTLQVMEFKA